MSDEWPSWRYDPETRRGQIFDSPEAVPEGWVEDLSAPLPEGVVAPMTKGEITAALKGGKIDFPANGTRDQLEALLRDKLTAVLTARKVEFVPTADTRSLLALIG